MESRAIYDLLEKEIIPLFYDRGADGIPRGWIGAMKASLQSLCPVFSTDRMVQEYSNLFYAPSFRQWQLLIRDDMVLARDLAAWRDRLHRQWHQIRIQEVQTGKLDDVGVGLLIPVSATVLTGDIPEHDLAVDVYYGVLDSRGVISGGETAPLARVEEVSPGVHRFSGSIECRLCGRQGFLVRVLPRHNDLGPIYEAGMLLWG